MWVWISKVEHPDNVLPNSFFDITYRLWHVSLPFKKITLFTEIMCNGKKIGCCSLSFRPWWFWGYKPFILTYSIDVDSLFMISAGYDL